MKIWAKTKEFSEGKFLVVRRDGTIPAWPHFVLGARDPVTPFALRAYADRAAQLGYDAEYVASIRELAADYEAYRLNEGPGDPESPPHRKDNPAIIDLMRGAARGVVMLIRDAVNQRKEPPVPPIASPVSAAPTWQNDVRCLDCDFLCPPPPDGGHGGCLCDCHRAAVPTKKEEP